MDDLKFSGGTVLLYSVQVYYFSITFALCLFSRESVKHLLDCFEAWLYTSDSFVPEINSVIKNFLELFHVFSLFWLVTRFLLSWQFWKVSGENSTLGIHVWKRNLTFFVCACWHLNTAHYFWVWVSQLWS